MAKKKESTERVANPKYVKRFEVNKDDLTNIYGRLKVADYMVALINRDIYNWVRQTTLKRLNIPGNWAIMHDPDWKNITVIAPEDSKNYRVAIKMEEVEIGSMTETPKAEANAEETKAGNE